MLHNEHLTIEKLDYHDSIIHGTVSSTNFSWTQQIFYFLHLLLPKDSISLPFACFFIAVSFCQMLSLLIDPQIQFGSYPSTDWLFLYLLQQTTLKPLLMYCTTMILYLGVLDLFAILIIIITLMGIWSRIFPKGNIAGVLCAAIPSFYWLGVIPVTYYLFSIWNCSGKFHPISQDLQCWSLAHIIHLCILTPILVLWVIVILPAFVFLMAYADIDIDDPFAHFYSCFELNYLLLRVCLSAIEAASNSTTVFYFLIGLALITILYFSSLLGNSFPYYNRTISLVFTSSMLSTAFINTLIIILSLLNSFNVNVTATSSILTLFVFLSCGLAYNLRNRRMQGILKNQVQESAEELDTLAIMCAYKTVWNFYVEDFNDDTLEGFFALHKKCCGKPDCPLCNSDENAFPSNEHSSMDNNENKQLKEEILKKHFVLYLYNNKANKDITDIRIVLQISRMHLDLLGNANQAYAKLVDASTMDPSWIMQFILYCTKMNIIAFVEEKKGALFKHGVCNYYEVLELEAIHERISQKISLSAEKRYAFWTELRSESTSLNLIRDLGYELLEVNAQIEKLWKALTDIYPNHTESVDLYSKYLIYVLGEEEYGRQVSERIKEKQENHEAKVLDKPTLFSPKAASIIISGNGLDSGHIIKASQKVKDIFDFNPSELVGRDISILMPKFIGQHHYEFIKKHSQNGIEKKGRPFIKTFGLHNSGHIIPIKITHQLLCTFKLGMTFVGIIQLDEENKDYEFLITNIQGNIEGVTTEIGKRLEIKNTLLESGDYMIQSMLDGPMKHFIEEYPGWNGVMDIKFAISKNVNKKASEEFVKSMFYNLVTTIMDRKAEKPKHDVKVSLPAPPDNEDKKRFTIKCDVSTSIYDNLSVKVFKFPKEINIGNENQMDESMERELKILYDIVDYVPGIKRKLNSLYLTKKRQMVKCSERLFSVPATNNINNPASSTSKLIAMMTKGKRPLLFLKSIEAQLKKTRETSAKRALANKNGPAISDDEENVPLTSQIEPPKFDPIEVKIEKKKEAKAKNLNFDDIQSSSSSSSTQSHRLLKIIKRIRKMEFENFYPDSVRRLNWMGLLFICGLFLLITARVIIAVYYTYMLEYLPSIIKYNGDRLNSYGEISKSVIQLLMLVPDANGSIPINLTTRNAYNYNEIKQSEENSTIGNFREWAISNLDIFTSNMQNSQQIISEQMSSFEDGSHQMVDPENITILYNQGNGLLNPYYMSERCAALSVVDHSEKIIELAIEESPISVNNFSIDFVKDMSLNTLTKSLSSAGDGIMNHCQQVASIHSSLSFSLLITIACILAVFLIVLVPFLAVITKDLAAALVMLIDIPKIQIRKQLLFIAKFIEETSKNYSSKEKIDFENFEEENEDSSLDAKAESSIHAKKTKTHRKGNHAVYEGNQYVIIFLILILCGVLIGLYLGLDKSTEAVSSTLYMQLDELLRITRILSGDSIFLGYLYQYISTQSQGKCFAIPCVQYIPGYITEMSDILEDLIVDHQRNQTVLPSAYNVLYQQIVESNPCVNPLFQNSSYCNSLMGGIFTLGSLSANNAFIELASSLYYDFTFSKRTYVDVKKYLNDKRLIDIEIMHEALLAPANNLLLSELQSDILNVLTSSVSIAFMFFAAFVVTFVLSGGVGWKMLIYSMNRAIFDTNVILAHLPPEIILSNNQIYDHLLKSNDVI